MGEITTGRLLADVSGLIVETDPVAAIRKMGRISELLKTPAAVAADA